MSVSGRGQITGYSLLWEGQPAQASQGQGAIGNDDHAVLEFTFNAASRAQIAGVQNIATLKSILVGLTFTYSDGTQAFNDVVVPINNSAFGAAAGGAAPQYTLERSVNINFTTARRRRATGFTPLAGRVYQLAIRTQAGDSEAASATNPVLSAGMYHGNFLRGLPIGTAQTQNANLAGLYLNIEGDDSAGGRFRNYTIMVERTAAYELLVSCNRTHDDLLPFTAHRVL